MERGGDDVEEKTLSPNKEMRGRGKWGCKDSLANFFRAICGHSGRWQFFYLNMAFKAIYLTNAVYT